MSEVFLNRTATLKEAAGEEAGREEVIIYKE